MPETLLVLDSVTHLLPEHRGEVSICGSHGGIYAGYIAAKMGTGGVILSDAGIGRDEAGLAGIKMLDDLGVPAAAISHLTARIGDGADCYRRGRLSYVNTAAYRLGLEPQMAAADAYAMMDIHCDGPSPPPPEMAESRKVLETRTAAGKAIIVVDSNSLIRAGEDDGAIVISGSHGAVLGGDAASASKADVSAVICNDAGFGIDDAGVSRLPALQERGIAAACVSAQSARIGDGMSTYADGVISALNAAAEERGGAIGQPCKDFVAAMAAGA